MRIELTYSSQFLNDIILYLHNAGIHNPKHAREQMKRLTLLLCPSALTSSVSSSSTIGEQAQPVQPKQQQL